MKNINVILKQMRGTGRFYDKINQSDMISYSRSGGYHTLTIHYDIGTKRRKTEGFDSYLWNEVEGFIRRKFDFYCNRKTQ